MIVSLLWKYALTGGFVFSCFLGLGEVCGQYLSQGYIAALPHMQSEMGLWEVFDFDDIV